MILCFNPRKRIYGKIDLPSFRGNKSPKAMCLHDSKLYIAAYNDCMEFDFNSKSTQKIKGFKIHNIMAGEAVRVNEKIYFISGSDGEIAEFDTINK